MPDWLGGGFSSVGLCAVVLQQIPGIIRAVRPPSVDPFAHNSGTVLVEVLEKFFGIGTIVLLVVVFTKVPVFPSVGAKFLIAAFAVLAAYYVFYIAYYLGVTTLPILLGMAAFPPLSFLLIALYQGNYLALVTSTMFGAVHVGLTYANLGHRSDRASDAG